jgi:hypothetical protein
MPATKLQSVEFWFARNPVEIIDRRQLAVFNKISAQWAQFARVCHITEK